MATTWNKIRFDFWSKIITTEIKWKFSKNILKDKKLNKITKTKAYNKITKIKNGKHKIIIIIILILKNNSIY